MEPHLVKSPAWMNTSPGGISIWRKLFCAESQERWEEARGKKFWKRLGTLRCEVRLWVSAMQTNLSLFSSGGLEGGRTFKFSLNRHILNNDSMLERVRTFKSDNSHFWLKTCPSFHLQSHHFCRLSPAFPEVRWSTWELVHHYLLVTNNWLVVPKILRWIFMMSF